MTSADGTTFIIAYQYANDGESEADDVVGSSTREVPQSNPVNEEPVAQQQQAPLGNLGADVDREFLENFLSGRECLPGGTGWWKYEICYGKHVIQFHVNIFERKIFCHEKFV